MGTEEYIANMFRGSAILRPAELAQDERKVKAFKKKEEDKKRRRPRLVPLEQIDAATAQWMRTRAIKPKRYVDQMDEAHYKGLFKLLDSDGNGTLDLEEMTDALHYLGLQCSRDDLRSIFSHVDSDFDNEITFEEFILALASLSEWDSLYTVLKKNRSAARKKKAQEEELQIFRDTKCSKAGLSRIRFDRLKDHGTKQLHENQIHATDEIGVVLPFTLWVPAYHRGKIFEKMDEEFTSLH